MIEKQIYIITGGPGFGKTALIKALKDKNYRCSDEYAHELILEQQKSGGEILPWKNPRLFQQEILKKRADFFESIPNGTIAFADRGIPDQLAFARYKQFAIPEFLISTITRYRYAPKVFVTPPWPEIYTNNQVRTETFEEATLIHNYILETYDTLNYQITELPLSPIDQRINLIINNL